MKRRWAIGAAFAIACAAPPPPPLDSAREPAEGATSLPPRGAEPLTQIATCEEPCTGCTTLVSEQVSRSRTATTEELAALRTVFLKYLDSEECQTDEQHASATDIGTKLPDVSDVKFIVDGSFRKAGASETLVNFFMGHCGLVGIHAEGWGTSVLVLLQDAKVVHVSTDGPTTAVEAHALDFDGDGLTELVTATGDYASGTTFSAAEVWRFGTQPAAIARFEMSLDSCLMPEGEHFESVLLLGTRHGHKCLLQRRHDEACPPDEVDEP